MFTSKFGTLEVEVKCVISLSKQDARLLLSSHHFQELSLANVFKHLGSVQFDPLNPVGRNHDLVLQARVPNYRVDDWQSLAYQDRFIYDSWDKQASLVLMQDWPLRRIYHRWHEAIWRKKILKPHQETIAVVLDELRERGPLTSTEFEHQPHVKTWEGSWYGPKLTKNVLRALWHTGQVVTHSRKKGHHVYDLTERVIPADLLSAKVPSEQESLEWLVKLRHRAVGLLRPNASWEVWSLDIKAAERKRVLADLVNKGELLPVEVEGVLFHALPEVLESLDSIKPIDRMIFIAPLDQLVWDRKAVAHLFDFDYIWEVYKPEKDRRWGYYVLPVLYKDKLAARFDSRFKEGVWNLYKWHWEADVTPDADMLAALEKAVSSFKTYLGAEKVKLPRGMDKATKDAWRAGAK